MILAVDPGVTIGWAIFEDDGEIHTFGQTHKDEFPKWLADQEYKFHTIVVEDYVLYRKKAVKQSGSNMPASLVIGQLEMFAAQQGAKLVKQQADILPNAQKISGIKMPSDHSISHQFSALNHGIYWLVKNKMREGALARGDIKL